MIAEGAGFGRAAGRVVLRIEVEDHVLAAELFQRDVLAARGGHLEVGREIADFRFVEVLHQLVTPLPNKTFSATSTAFSAELRRSSALNAVLIAEKVLFGSGKVN